MSQNSRNQGFSNYICLMIERFGSGRHKNTWIRWIRNTAPLSLSDSRNRGLPPPAAAYSHRTEGAGARGRTPEPGSKVGNKNPHKKPTQKNHSKKPSKNVFFLGFLYFKFFMKIIETFFSLKQIFYEQIRHKL
jgi:hypothetical protein